MIEIECSTFYDVVEVISSSSYVCLYEFFLNIRVADDEHDVCWVSELVDVRCEALVSNNHWLELVFGLDATQLELLYDIWDFLEPMYIFVVNRIVMRDHKESTSFKNYSFVGSYGLAELG
jgi:hypothetical protein